MIYDDKFHEVNFGHINYSDFTKLSSEDKREAYLRRANNFRGKWKDNLFSPNNFAIDL